VINDKNGKNIERKQEYIGRVLPSYQNAMIGASGIILGCYGALSNLVEKEINGSEIICVGLAGCVLGGFINYFIRK